jgi:hypothetical protein
LGFLRREELGSLDLNRLRVQRCESRGGPDFL